MKGGSDRSFLGSREAGNSFMTKSDQHHSDTHSSRRRKRLQQQTQDWSSAATEKPARYPCYGPCRVENKTESSSSNPADTKRAEEAKSFYCSQGRRALQHEVKRRASMASVVLKSLSILLGIFFIFVGTTKLTPRVSKELYKELLPHSSYLIPVTSFQIAHTSRVKQVANLTLVLMMLFATYNHWMVGDKFERIAPSLVFFFMLTCRLIVEFQIKRKERLEQKEKVEQLTKLQEQPDQIQQTTSASASGKFSSGATETNTEDSTATETNTEDSTATEANTEDSTATETNTEDSTATETNTEDSTATETNTEDSTATEDV
ncbi:hypothetical protein FHG87_005130 [Trinorchestia longiramus]|nr:hypothetical protein FHG87_005130 [Trinorchestia longiramus]